MKVLLIESDPALLQNISKYFQTEGVLFESATGLQSGRRLAMNRNFDCLLMDLSGEQKKDMQNLKEIMASRQNAGIVLIAENCSALKKEQGIFSGVDACLEKPLRLAGLRIMIGDIIRKRQFKGKENLRFGKLTLNLTERSIAIGGQPVGITRMEFDLLLLLIKLRDNTVSRYEIAEYLWGQGNPGKEKFNVIYTHMKNLRKKFELAGSPSPIKSVYGRGYRFASR
jgi:DNA-binding response OmpR family regulator